MELVIILLTTLTVFFSIMLAIVHKISLEIQTDNEFKKALNRELPNNSSSNISLSDLSYSTLYEID